MEEAKKLVDTHQKNWRRILDQYPGVTAVDVNYGHVKGMKTNERCIVIWVKKKMPVGDLPEKHILPRVLDGCPVDVIEEEVKLLEGKWPTEIDGKQLASSDDKDYEYAKTDQTLCIRSSSSKMPQKWPTGGLSSDDGSLISTSDDDRVSSEDEVFFQTAGRRLRQPNPGAIRPMYGLSGGDSISIIGVNGGTGTLGYFLRKGNALGFLTNAHVVESCGTRIVSPSREDGGTPKNWIGTTTMYSTNPQEYMGATYGVDCAFVSLRGILGLRIMMRDGIIITKKSLAMEGNRYRFWGRTSRKSSGFIESIIWCGIVEGKYFANQILMSNTVLGGDSGSLLCNGRNEAIGLVIGSSKRRGLANHIDPVLNALRAQLP